MFSIYLIIIKFIITSENKAPTSSPKEFPTKLSYIFINTNLKKVLASIVSPTIKKKITDIITANSSKKGSSIKVLPEKYVEVPYNFAFSSFKNIPLSLFY